MPDAEMEAIVAKHVRSTGLAALGLYHAGSTTGPSGPAIRISHPFVDEVVAILRVCQTAADEIDLLKPLKPQEVRDLFAYLQADKAPRE